MSRAEYSNDKFTIAFGVDPTTSAFFQVWQPEKNVPDDEEQPLLLGIDNQGIRVNDPKNLLPPKVVRMNAQTKERFEISRRMGNPYPNLDALTVVEYAKALGFGKDVETNIYELWD